MAIYQYLKDYAYYSELYDRMTIDDCECWDSEVSDAYKKNGEKFDPEKPKRTLHGGLVADLTLYFKKGEYYANKIPGSVMLPGKESQIRLTPSNTWRSTRRPPCWGRQPGYYHPA